MTPNPRAVDRVARNVATSGGNANHVAPQHLLSQIDSERTVS
jgi:hypothetical protein